MPARRPSAGLAPWARATYRPEVLGDIGAFAGFFRAPRRYRHPVFLASTDGVGSKLRVAFLAGRHDTIGIDLVAMGVNDLLVHGAEPLVFLDYIGINRVVPRTVETVVRGIAAGCREAGCALIGGEIAELPDFYAAGEYDLAGFALGVAERSRLIDGRGVRPGDAVIGLSRTACTRTATASRERSCSSGSAYGCGTASPASTGRSVASYSRPTRIYVKPVLALLRAGVPIRAMAHITGGGLTGNLPRVLPAGCRAVIDRGTWPVSEVFRWLQGRGRIDEAEMFRVFNMGIGFVLVVPHPHAARVLARLWRSQTPAFQIGEIRRGARGVTYH